MLPIIVAFALGIANASSAAQQHQRNAHEQGNVFNVREILSGAALAHTFIPVGETTPQTGPHDESPKIHVRPGTTPLAQRECELDEVASSRTEQLLRR